MRKAVKRLVAAAVVAVAVTAVGAAAERPAGAGTEARARYLRRTPIVEAVQKTRDGIITLKVIRQGSWGKRHIAGTGVVVDERGYAITNHHVIQDAERIVVTLADKSTVEAKVHTPLPSHDLAILLLPKDRKYRPLPLGPGSDVMVGETVIAVGNPFGYAGSVTTGIVSYVGREITLPTGETLANLIQHTALINPGNSGGPLLNINGELIGINVALREGAQGISFAINADTVQRVLARHLGADKVAKVGHGLRCSEVVSEGRDRQKVVVDSNSPSRFGPRKGDVLVKLGSLEVRNCFDIERALWGHKAGDKVEATVLRGGKVTTVLIPLSKAEPTRISSAAGRDR